MMSTARTTLAAPSTSPSDCDRAPRPRRRAAFSLIEVVIVVVIIGIIAAIAVPRLSRGASGANDAVHAGNLRLLRDAVNRYYIEHGTYPSAVDDGGQAKAALQLTKFTDALGNTSLSKSSTFSYGPYLRKIPALAVGSHRGNLISATTGQNVGWLYDETTGEITANTGTDADATGRKYSDY